jgi:hypothetical protein
MEADYNEEELSRKFHPEEEVGLKFTYGSIVCWHLCGQNG